MNVSIVVIRAIAEELSRRGLDASAVLSSVGVAPSKLDDPGERVTTDEYVAVVEAAIARTADPALGLHVGASSQSTAHVVGHAALASVTLRDAVETYLRYSPLLIDSVEYDTSIRGDLASIAIRHAVVPRRVAAFGAEYALAMMVGVVRRFVPGALAREVRLRHRPNAEDHAYTAVFGCPVRFGADADVLVVDTAYLDVRQHHADPPLASLLRSRAESMLASGSVRERLPSRIRDLVRQAASPKELGVETIAETLGVGSRTLRRRLGHGGGVRAIVASTKRELAEQMLRDESITIKEISYRLGFSEPSAFHRAFKRWTKMTPVDFRVASRQVERTDSVAPAALEERDQRTSEIVPRADALRQALAR